MAMSAQASSPGSSYKDSSRAASIALGSEDSEDDDELLMEDDQLLGAGLLKSSRGGDGLSDAALSAGLRTDAEKHQSMLLALCTGLGATTTEQRADGKMVRSIEAGDDCLMCIQDIQRYLRRDDSMKSIFKLLASWDIVQTRLLPIIFKYQNKKQLQFAATKLVVMLTMPPETGYSEAEARQRKDVVARIRADTRKRDALAFLIVPPATYLLKFKEAFLEKHVLRCFVDMLTDSFSRDGYDRDEHDLRVIELVLSLFRNLLHVPNAAPTASTRSEHLTHLQEDFVCALQEEYVLELVLHLIQNVGEEDTKEWNLLLLEIMYLLLRGQSPEILLKSLTPQQLKEKRLQDLENRRRKVQNGSGSKRIMLSPQERQVNYDLEDPLLAISEDEVRAQKARFNAMGSRHSHFGGIIRFSQNDTTKDKGVLSTRSLADPTLNQRWKAGGVVAGTSIGSELGIRGGARGSRATQTLSDIAASRTAAADGSARPSALTVGCGLGKKTHAMTAGKTEEVKAALKELVEEFLKTGYGPLLASAKLAFVHESDRLLPSDLIQMMYIR